MPVRLLPLLLLVPALCGAAAPAPEPPAGNWKRVNGALVNPAMTVAWHDLLQFDLRDGRLDIYARPAEPLAGFVANGRVFQVEIEGAADPVWQVRGIPKQPGATLGQIFLSAVGAQFRGAPHFLRPVSVITTGDRMYIRGNGEADGRQVTVSFRVDGGSIAAPLCHLIVTPRDPARPAAPVGANPAAKAKAANPNGANPNAADAPISVQAATPGQLRREHPDLVRKYVEPVLDPLAGGAHLLRGGDADVFRAFPSIPPDARAVAQLHELLPLLDSPASTDRRAGSERLELLGRPAVLAAARLDLDELSPEQRSRINAFLARHGIGFTEQEARHDPYFLTDCLQDDDRAVRAAALEAIRAIATKPVAFDIDAPPAERTTAAAALLDELPHPEPSPARSPAAAAVPQVRPVR